jgi:hypothetical protein
VDALLHVGLSNAVLATVLALAAGCVGCLCRRPALVHSLWVLVLLKLITPPLVPLPILQPVNTEPPRERAANEPGPEESGPGPGADESPELKVEVRKETTSANPGPMRDRVGPAERELSATVPPPVRAEATTVSWQSLLAAVWPAGCLVWWGLAAYRIGRFRRVLRQASAAGPALQEQASQVARRLGLSWCPRVWLVPAPIGPLLWAVAGRARILLPAALWERCTPEQQETETFSKPAILMR